MINYNKKITQIFKVYSKKALIMGIVLICSPLSFAQSDLDSLDDLDNELELEEQEGSQDVGNLQENELDISNETDRAGTTESTIMSQQERIAYSETKAMLGDILKVLLLGRGVQARKFLEKISKEKKNILQKHTRLNFYWHRFMGSALEKLGKTGMAIKYYKEALRLNPNDAFSAFKSSRLYLDLGKKTKAKKYINHALKIEPSNEIIVALDNKINAQLKTRQEPTHSGLSYVKWQAGLTGGVAYPFNKLERNYYNIAPIVKVFFHYSPTSLMYIGMSLNFFYGFSSPSISKVNIDYKTSRYWGTFDIGLKIPVSQKIFIGMGFGFGYYYSNSSVSGNSNLIDDMIASGNLFLNWLFLDSMSVIISVNYVNYFQNKTLDFNNLLHSVDSQLGVSYAYF